MTTLANRRRALLPALLTVMDAIVVSAALRTLASVASPAIGPPRTLALVVLAAVAVAALAAATARSLTAARITAITGAIASGFVLARLNLFPAEPLFGAWMESAVRALLGSFGRLDSVGVTFAASSVVWWRAARHVADAGAPGRVRRAVTGAFVALVVIAVMTELAVPVNLAPYLTAAAVLGLAALALSRVDEAAPPGEAVAMGPAWGLVVAAAIVGVIASALAVSAVVSVDLASAVAAWLAPLPAVLAHVVVLVVSIVMEGIAFLMRPLSEALGEALAQRANMLAGTGEPLVLDGPEGASSFPAWLTRALRAGALAAVALAVAAWLAKTVRRYTTQAVDPSLIGREIEASPAQIAGEFADWLGTMRRRVLDAIGPLSRRDRGVRGLYHAFLSRMADAGLPRPGHETPWEFAPAAGELVAAARAEVNVLTAAYVLSRYGERDPEPKALADLERGMARINAAAEAGRRT